VIPAASIQHAGTYTVSADVNGCLAGPVNVTAQVNPLPVLTFQVINESCFFGNDGSIDLTVASGSPPFSFNWSNGAATEDLSNVAAGSYAVTVTDPNGCEARDSATVGLGLGFVIVDTCRWVGNVDSNWFNPCNWKKSAVPDTTCHVLIPGGTLHNPFIGQDTAFCKTLIIDAVNLGHNFIDAGSGGLLIKRP